MNTHIPIKFVFNSNKEEMNKVEKIKFKRNNNNKRNNYLQILKENKLLKKKINELTSTMKEMDLNNKNDQKIKDQENDIMKTIFHFFSIIYSQSEQPIIYGGFVRSLMEKILFGKSFKSLNEGDIDIYFPKEQIPFFLKYFKNIGIIKEDDFTQLKKNEAYRAYSFTAHLKSPYTNNVHKIDIDMVNIFPNKTDFDVNNFCIHKDGITIINSNNTLGSSKLFTSFMEEFLYNVNQISKRETGIFDIFNNSFIPKNKDEEIFAINDRTMRNIYMHRIGRFMKINTVGYKTKLFSKNHNLLKIKINSESKDCCCSICQENLTISDFYNKNTIMLASCKHEYHFDCIKPWFLGDRSNGILCPLCRIPIRFYHDT